VKVAARRQFRLGDHVRRALAAGRGVVALETTLIAHGLPSPDNLEVARLLEQDVRDQGAEAATVGVVGGVATVGLTPTEIERLADPSNAVIKLSRRDLGVAVAAGVDGATTVAGTITLAAAAGLEVMATGGLGGVHRGADTTWDVSADLETMRDVPVLVVASGVKSILDVAATLERLETLGVPVVGYGTACFPGFYVSATEHRLDWTVSSPEEAARAFATHRRLAPGGMLLANPVAAADQLDPARHDAALSEALRLAEAAQLSGKTVTPFLLAHIAATTAGESVRVNRSIVRANAALAGRIAVALAAARRSPKAVPS
jgi:pseudouridine-5'-phosphate glycosidase